LAAAAIWRHHGYPSLGNNNKQKLTHNNHTYNEVEGPRFNNNQPEIYDNDQEQPNEMNDDNQILSTKLSIDDYNAISYIN
jgi:hypothetical protein